VPAGAEVSGIIRKIIVYLLINSNKMNSTIEKSLRIVHTLSNDGGKFGYFEDLLESFKEDEDYLIIKTKMDNLVEKLNSITDHDDLMEYMTRDFETEIWETL
jgi:hypothetical protein